MNMLLVFLENKFHLYFLNIFLSQCNIHFAKKPNQSYRQHISIYKVQRAYIK